MKNILEPVSNENLSKLAEILEKTKNKFKNHLVKNMIIQLSGDTKLYKNLEDAIDFYIVNIKSFEKLDIKTIASITRELSSVLGLLLDQEMIQRNIIDIIDRINFIIAIREKLNIIKESPDIIDILAATGDTAKIKGLEEDKLKMKGQLQELQEQLNNYKKDFDTVTNLIEKASNAELGFNNAKESVLKSIQLQISYKYWEDQVGSFFKKYILYSVVSIILSSLLLGFVFYFLNKYPLIINDVKVQKTELISIADENQSNVKAEIKAKSFEIWRYGFLLLLISMGIWLIRILVKITLSNYHLSIDANERVVMIRTYLSLLEEGRGFEKEDKKVMLDNIFRPTNFGIIKDESVVTITDLLSSFKK